MKVTNMPTEGNMRGASLLRKTVLSVYVILITFVASLTDLGCERASPVGSGSIPLGSDLVIERDRHLNIMRNEDSTRLVSIIDTSSLIEPNSILVPKLSPDKKLISFYAHESFLGSNFVLCTVGVNGKGLRILADVSMPGHTAQLTYSWSPNGTMIAYSSPKDGGNSIYVAKTYGAGSGRLFVAGRWPQRRERRQCDMKLDFLFSFQCALASVCFAQGYYPPEVGNPWDYGFIDYTGKPFLTRCVTVTGDTTFLNGKKHAALSDFTYLRQEGDTVYAYTTAHGEKVLYDLSRQYGDTLIDLSSNAPIVAVESRGADTVFGRLTTVWGFNLRSSVSSYYRFDRVADSIGCFYGV